MSLSLIIGLLAVFTALSILFIKWRQQYWTRKGVPQLNPKLVFGDIGPLITGTKSIQDHFLEMYKTCKAAGLKYVGTYSMIFPEFVPFDTDLIKLILMKDFTHFGSHGLYHNPNDPITMHLFNLDGEAWKERRIKLTPIFTTGKMKMMFETVNSKTAGLVQTIGKHIDANEAVDIKDTLARFTTDVIGSVAFGLDCDTLNEPKHKFREIGRIAFTPRLKNFLIESTFSSKFLGKLGYHSLPNEVESYFSQVVKDTIHYRESSGVQRKDFMQLMLQLKNQGAITGDDNLTDTKKGKHFINVDEIISEAFLFYLAGFETSASTMTFAFFELAQNPDVQEKLREEILETLKRHDGKITYDSLVEMEYLDKVIKETLRKYPVVSVLPRKCTKDYTLPNSDIIIEKGTNVQIPVLGLHMDPEFYPNPERFNPENFSPESKAKRPDITWIPFGEGPRQCIGLRFGVMQSKIGIVALLKDFRFTLDPAMKPPYETDRLSIVYAFKKPCMLRATRL